MVEVLQHPTGLISKRPEGMNAEQVVDGYVFTTAGIVRSPLRITLTLRKTSEPPDISPAWFGLLGMRYRATMDEGGSGGAGHGLVAAKPLDKCWLELGASQQSETGTPSFLEAWAILAESAVHAEAGC